MRHDEQLDRFLHEELAPDAASEPAPPEKRPAGEGVALCLSGGGYRAALFHLGAVRRLDELGLLARVGAISSVSGGSLLAAFLATSGGAWARGAGRVFEDFEAQVAVPFRRFTGRNVRTPAILRRLLPWNWLRDDAAARGLERAYDRHLTRRARLAELPERPRFVFCATDMVFGVNWISERERAGDYLAGYGAHLPERWPLARAVAASSCFPPVFNPLRLGLAPGELQGGKAAQASGAAEARRLVAQIGLSDGGVYDNLGLEPVWESASTLLLSDGGATFPYASPRNPFRRLLRYAAVATNQVQALRYRWLGARRAAAGLQWAVWRISHVRGDAHGYPEELVRRRISAVRTDLDAFSAAEAAVLENHGYLLADRVRRYLEEVPTPGPLAVPNPEWMNPERAERALAGSAERRLLGRWR